MNIGYKRDISQFSYMYACNEQLDSAISNGCDV